METKSVWQKQTEKVCCCLSDINPLRVRERLLMIKIYFNFDWAKANESFTTTNYYYYYYVVVERELDIWFIELDIWFIDFTWSSCFCYQRSWSFWLGEEKIEAVWAWRAQYMQGEPNIITKYIVHYHLNIYNLSTFTTIFKITLCIYKRRLCAVGI